MRASDTITVGSLVAAEVYRRSLRAIRSGPLYRWRFAGGTPENLVAVPNPLRPSHAAIADEIYSGLYVLGGEPVSTHGDSPFAVEAPSTEWFEELHAFRWLRHLEAASTDLAAANAVALVSDWIDQHGSQYSGPAWRCDITAARIITWITHAELLTRNAGVPSQTKLLKSLGRQARYLNINARTARHGYPRLISAIASAYASLCLADWDKTLRQSARELTRELDRQVLADGIHISRNPIVHLEILADLIPLKDAFIKKGTAVPPSMQSAIDRMMLAVHFLSHSNGLLGQFNGTGHTPSDLMSELLAHDTSSGPAMKSAPHGGYERLHAGETVVLIDTGKPLSRASARNAMAGTLSFEMSSGEQRFIANCGLPQIEPGNYLPYARATAAHSTVTINDTSSSRFSKGTWSHSLLPSPLIEQPGRIDCEREDSNDEMRVVASHNGYAPSFGIIHERELVLSADGTVLKGIERFRKSGKWRNGETGFALRFHMPPTVNASHLASGHSVLIAAQNSDAWTFTCVDAPIELAESIQFSGPGEPRKSEQIVVHGDVENIAELRWMLTRTGKKAKGRVRKSAKKIEPDLLSALTKKADPEPSTPKSGN